VGVVRKDYFLERYVYYSTKRGMRPKEFTKTFKEKSSKTCFFCPKMEHATPSEIGRVKYKDSWKLRWFKNKFPAVELKGSPTLKGTKFLRQSPNYGMHEIIVETPHHKSELADVPSRWIAELLQVYRARIKGLSKKKEIKYVQIFKNHGGEAGTSIIHEHSQVVSLPHIPTSIQEKITMAKKFGADPYASIIAIEKDSERKVMENSAFLAFCPFASRFNYEVWILPKKPLRSFEQFEPVDYELLADILKHVLVKLKQLNVSYNYYVCYSPKGEKLRFHIEITPRIATWAGFELGTGMIINSVFPEDAAKFYRRK